MVDTRNASVTAVLLSGGLDSCILVGQLLDQERSVQPIYIRSDLVWERRELAAVKHCLAAFRSPLLRDLVVLQLPLTDVYGDHWSVTGNGVPGPQTPDEAVYLPGRNALLVVKAAVWCQLQGVPQLALAPLGSSPFADATAEFFESFQRALTSGGQHPLEIVCPFATMTKSQVMHLGRLYPLELTFSCLSPQAELHCGNCNKCAERQAAFRSLNRPDPTLYARRHA